MLDPLRFDPRLEAGAYITDGENLYQVVRRMKGQVILVNCINEVCERTLAWGVLRDFTLVKRSPQTPVFGDTYIGDPA
jgi:hypothetical protein